MPISQQLWSGFEQTGDVAVRTVLAYVVALALVRLAGRRTLAQLSAFDIVVTIAAGTVVGSTALPSRPAVSDGVTVLATLMLLQVLLGRPASARRPCGASSTSRRVPSCGTASSTCGARRRRPS